MSKRNGVGKESVHPASWRPEVKIAVWDFDGTIFETAEGFPMIGSVIPEAIALAWAYRRAGWENHVQSCRGNRHLNPGKVTEYRLQMIDALRSADFPVDYVDKGDCGKLKGDIYIDDLSVCPWAVSYTHLTLPTNREV